MDRDHTTVRGNPILHTTLQRDWICRCGGKLRLKWLDGWRVVCLANHQHPTDQFIHHSTYERDQDLMAYYQDYYERRKTMGFVKDRHDETGKILGEPRVRRTGRIALGEQGEGGRPVNLPYFRFVPNDEGDLAGAILSQVHEAIEEHAPGIDPVKPTILPVFLPADSLDLMASSSYQAAGKGGITRCAGDGETIQFKMGASNRLEVSKGKVMVPLQVDDQKFSRGEEVRCPGRSFDSRWSHCEKCKLRFRLDLQLAGLPYIWSLSTGDQDFYDQFFTVLELMVSHVAQGNARFMSEIPLLLRKEQRTKGRPDKSRGAVELRFQEFDLISIEIHPTWLAGIQAKRTQALGAGIEVKQYSLPEPEPVPEPEPEPTWYKKAYADSPERPWDALDVGVFVTNAMQHYREDDEDADDYAGEGNVTAVRGILHKLYAKGMDPLDAANAADTVLWFLFGSAGPWTNAQMAAIYRWARKDYEGGTVPHSEFEEEALVTLQAAAEMAAKAGPQVEV